MEVVPTLTDAVIVLASLVLATSGVQVALHFVGHFRQSNTNGQPRKCHDGRCQTVTLEMAVLPLMITGVSTLVLHVVSIMCGLDIAFIRVLLLKVMGLFCSLFFAKHLCASFRELIKDRHCSLADVPELGATETQMLRNDNICGCVLRFLAPTLEYYLITFTSATTVLSILQPPSTFYQCMIPTTASDHHSIHLLQSSVLHSADVLPPTIDPSQVPTQSLSSVALIDFLLCSGTCTYQSSEFLLLYCAFFLPLFVYVVVNFSLCYYTAPGSDSKELNTEQGVQGFSFDGQTTDFKQEPQLQVLPTTSTGQVDGYAHGNELLTENTLDGPRCGVCQSLSRYILLTALIFLGQCFFVWPLWGAVVKSKCGQVQIPSLEFSFLPLFTAVCFVYRAVVNN